MILDRILRTLELFRVLDALALWRRGRCTVLLYHSVQRGSPNPYLEPELFQGHMDMLSSEFRVLDAGEYLYHLQRGKPFPPRSVLITFDDGFENNLRVVQPIMADLQLPWVLFATTGPLDQPGSLMWMSRLRAVCLFAPAHDFRLLDHEWRLEPGLAPRTDTYKALNRKAAQVPFRKSLEQIESWVDAHWHHVPDQYIQAFCSVLSAEQLRQLHSSGLVEVGCHTHSHPFLPNVEEEDLHRELAGSTLRLREILGSPPRMFAYPSGRYGSREIRWLRKLNYQCAFAVVPVLGRDARFEIERTGIYRSSPAVVRSKALGLSQTLRSFGIRNG